MITAIIQARLSSTRLPGKVMTTFSGNTLLGHILERLSFAKSLSAVVVATTDSKRDDTLVEWLEKKGVAYYRGSESDVLNRYYEAAEKFGARHIARITSDDPFKDPKIIDAVAELYFSEKLDFAYNNHPPTFAEGLDTEIFSMDALRTAEKASADPFEREHMTQYLYRHPEKFRQKNLANPVDFSHHRWTIDTEKDLDLAKKVYDDLYMPGRIFLAEDILRLIEKKPEIAQINMDVTRSAMYKKK
jgi:spore coat polysaccharide biosynthesis protein SpsF